MRFFTKIFRVLSILISVWIVLFIGFCGFVFSIKAEHPTLKTDAIVVLTGGQDRIETGLDLFSKGVSGTLYITGVHPDTSRDEILSKWDGLDSLPECCIEIGRKARSTYENALELQDWAKDKNVKVLRLVTSDYHMLRAFTEIKAMMPSVVITRTPVAYAEGRAFDPKLWSILISEFHKTLIRALVLTYAQTLP